MSDTPDVSAIISNYTFLEKEGNIYKGFCPFCNSLNEKLIVRPELNEWHCFQCGAGGNADDFIALYESMILHRDNKVTVENGTGAVAGGDYSAPLITDDAPAQGEEAANNDDSVLSDYFSRLRNVSGYQGAAIFDGNMQLIRFDNTDDLKVDIDRLNSLFISIIDDAHTVFGQDLTAMDSELILSAENGVVIYSSMRFREEPVHIIVLGNEKRQQYLMKMQAETLKKY